MNKHFLNNGENEKISNDVEEREGERERAREREVERVRESRERGSKYGRGKIDREREC